MPYCNSNCSLTVFCIIEYDDDDGRNTGIVSINNTEQWPCTNELNYVEFSKVSLCSLETLTADNLHSHAGMSMPLDRVELDVASQHGVVEVVVFHRVRVDVTFEHLDHTRHHHSARNKTAVLSHRWPRDVPLRPIWVRLMSLHRVGLESSLHPFGVGKWVPATAGRVYGRYVRRCLVRAMYLSASAVGHAYKGALYQVLDLYLYL